MTLIRLYSSIPKAYRPRLLLVILLSLGGAIAQGFSVGLLLPVLEYVQAGALPDGGVWSVLKSAFDFLSIPMNLPSLLIGVLLMIFLATVFVYLQRSTSIRLREKFAVQLKGQAFNSFVGADMAYLQSAGRGNLVNILTMETIQAADAMHSFVEFTARCILVSVYVGLLVLISWQISLSGLALVLLGSIMVQLQISRARKLGRAMVDLRNRFQSFVVERLEAVRLVKLNAMEATEQAQFAELAGDLSSHTHRRATSAAQIRLIMDPAIVGGGLLVLYLSVEVLDISLAHLAVFMYVLVRMAPEAVGLNQLFHAMSAGIASIENIYQGLNDSSKRTTVAGGAVPFHGLKREIKLNDMSCAYNHSQPVLQHVNITIHSGKLTAIMGPSGVGKSTLLDLLVRLADPTEGQILLDGTDIREFDLVSLRRQIGMVTQDVMLFSDTVMANLRYGHHGCTETEVNEAARKANAHQFIESLPQGYNTVLGYRGLTLSGGERQRLSLARALVGDPSILLLDEVTNNLDAESQRLIRDSIHDLTIERTVVVATHDSALIELADKVIVLEDMGVGEEGTPKQLLVSGGLFEQYYGYAQKSAGPHTQYRDGGLPSPGVSGATSPIRAGDQAE